MKDFVIQQSFDSNCSGRKRKTPEPPAGEEFYDADDLAETESNDSDAGEDFTDCFIMRKKACLESSANFSASPISSFINLVGLNLNSNSNAAVSEEKENSGGNSNVKNSCKELPRSMTWPLVDIACWS